MLCINCGTRQEKVGGRCHACYVYKQKTGAERPPTLWDNKVQAEARAAKSAKIRSVSAERKAQTRCVNCNTLGVDVRDECRACYQYRRTYGRIRPSYLYDGTRYTKKKTNHKCKACGAETARKNGLCAVCSKKAEVKLCVCGNVVTHFGVELQVHNSYVTYDLCDDCYAIEMRGKR